MRLVHFTDAAELDVRPEPEQTVAWKPHGLWLSDEDDFGWSHWNEEEQFRDTAAQHAFEVTLADGTNVLRMANRDDLLRFTVEFRGTPDWQTLERRDTLDWYIDWRRVAERHHGVLITPYVRDCRYDLMWYYGWDCASGCIWNPDAIGQIRRVEGAERG